MSCLYTAQPGCRCGACSSAAVSCIFLCSTINLKWPCRADAKNAHYQATIKQGDLLLNRLQRLAKIIDVE